MVAAQRKGNGLGALTTINTLVGAGMNAYQSHEQAKQEKVQAELAARELESRAVLTEQAAGAALQEGDLAMYENTLKGKAERSAQRVDYAASGVKVDSGSTAHVAADQAAWNEYERQKLEYEAKLKSWGLMGEASELRQKAANTRAAGVSPGQAATSSLFASGRSALDSFLSKL